MLGRSNSETWFASGVVGELSNELAAPWSSGVQGINRGLHSGIGVLGTHQGPGTGVYGTSNTGAGVVGYTGGTYGVYSYNDLGASGLKTFVQPHPTDAAREIRFVSLEGNESGTYFRGSGRLQNGRAVIEVPEDFRMVSEEESLTVQITERGPHFLWVESSDLNHIVVRGAADIEFDYFVNGVRRGYRDFQTVRQSEMYVPTVRGETFGKDLPAPVRELLVENGTLNADFTPNEATAHRMGWDLRDAGPDPTLRAPADQEIVRGDER